MRCRLCRAFYGALFLFSGAISSVFATELPVWPATSAPGAILEALAADTTFDRYRIELGGAAASSAMNFEDEAPAPLFTAPSVSDASTAAAAAGVNGGNGAGADSTGAEWDYLWRNASKISITSIPEPSTASLLIGAGILLWTRRARKAVR